MSIAYLAGPYTSKIKKTMKFRESELSRVAGELMLKGYCIYSPISETVAIAKHSNLKNTNWSFWRAQDLPKLAMCTQLFIVTLDGWKQSIGVRGEVKYAINHNIPICLVDAKTLKVSRISNHKLLKQVFEMETVEELND